MYTIILIPVDGPVSAFVADVANASSALLSINATILTKLLWSAHWSSPHIPTSCTIEEHHCTSDQVLQQLFSSHYQLELWLCLLFFLTLEHPSFGRSHSLECFHLLSHRTLTCITIFISNVKRMNDGHSIFKKRTYFPGCRANIIYNGLHLAPGQLAIPSTIDVSRAATAHNSSNNGKTFATRAMMITFLKV